MIEGVEREVNASVIGVVIAGIEAVGSVKLRPVSLEEVVTVWIGEVIVVAPF